MTNIHDIAKKSGYSVGTVSRVLNGQKYVSQAAKAAVLQAIKAFDYVPNRLARSLSSGQTHIYAVVVPDVQQAYYNALVRGVTAKLFEKHYQLLLLPSGYSTQTEQDYLEFLRQRMFDGLIFASHELPLEIIAQYLQYGSIVICHAPGKTALPAVYSRREKSYDQVFQLLKTQHLDKVSLIFTRTSKVSATTEATLKSFKKIYGRDPAPEQIQMGPITADDGYQLAPYYLKHPVDAILANADDVAAGILRYFNDHNIKPPKVIGQDCQLSGKLYKIPTIDHHVTELGAAAASLVTSGEHKSIALDSEFISVRH